jgi:drug/metabolite transporter (DMT)-like permease
MINLLLLLTVIFWGLSFVATKMALAYLSPVEIIALRLLLGTPVLYLVILFKKIDISFKKADYLIILIAAVVLAVHFLIQAFGLIYTSATNTAWLVATIPVFIAMMSRVFLKEKLSTIKLVGITVATLGVVLLISKGKLDSLGWLSSVGDWIILSSSITWGIYTIMTRNIARRNNPLAVSMAILIVPALVLNGYAAFTTPVSKILSLPPGIILVLIFLGVFCLGLAHWFWLEGLSRKGATEVGVYIYIEPVVTTIAAIPLLNEKLTLITIIGAAMIIAGVYLVQKKGV